MQMTLIKNPDASNALAYKIARLVCAESGANNLLGVEALTSMIHNLSVASGVDIEHIIQDKNIFPVLDENSEHHIRMTEPATSRRFKMCLRVAQRMLSGGLRDACYGATRFHHSDTMPQWAIARGYIADIDGMLFYL